MLLLSGPHLWILNVVSGFNVLTRDEKLFVWTRDSRVEYDGQTSDPGVVGFRV